MLARHSQQTKRKRMSAVSKALIEVEEFQKQLSRFLGVAASAVSSSRTAAKPWEVDEAALAVIAAGNQVESSLAAVNDHQANQSVIEETKKAIQKRTEMLRTLGITLEENERNMQKEIERAEQLLPAKGSEESSVPIDWVLQLARKLSFITRAPPNWHFKQMRPLPDRFHPPAPQVDDMKKSKLFKKPDVLLAQLVELEKASSKPSADAVTKSSDDFEWEDEEEPKPVEEEPPRKRTRTSSRT